MTGRTLLTNRALRWALFILAAGLVLYIALNWPRWQLRANMASGFGARIACGCRYIEGRDMTSCASDFRAQTGMSLVRFSDDPAHKTVHASVPLLARRKASFRDGFGCLPDRVN